MKKVYIFTKSLICIAGLLLGASDVRAQSVLAEWPFTAGPADSISATGVIAETPTLTHFYTSTVTATPAYSGAYGQAISPNDGLGGSGGEGDGEWKNGSGYDGPGGVLNFGYYEQFVIVAASGSLLNVDSLYLNTAISGTPDGAYLMAYYSFSGFRLDSASLDSCSLAMPVSVPERSMGILYVAKAFSAGGSITVNTGDTLTLRLYYAVGSTTAGRFALLKDVIIAGTVGSACIAEPAAFTTSSITVCPGATGVVYTVPNDPTALSYTWTYSGTGASFTSTTNSVSVNFSSSATSGTFSVVANAACGSSPARTLAVTVGALPSAGTISGTTTICTGATAALTDGSGTGTWSSGSPSIASINASGVVTALSTGIANITYTAINACGSAPAYTVVTVSGTAPTIATGVASATICAGSVATLTATGGTTYTWAPSTGLTVTTGATITASPGSNVTYTVTGTIAGCSNIATETVSVFSSIPLTATISNSGSNYALITSATSYTVYWYVNGTLTATFTSIPAWTYTVAPGATDNIWAEVVPTSGCYTPASITSADTLHIHVSSTGVAGITTGDNIFIYPNPCTDNFMINGCGQGDIVCITNLLGKEEMRYTCKGNNGAEPVPVAALSPALYIMRVLTKNGEQISVQKLIKE